MVHQVISLDTAAALFDCAVVGSSGIWGKDPSIDLRTIRLIWMIETCPALYNYVH